ncbi:MAG: hypothetical protein HY554_04755, partial [Elusimicrobia bacterium]|nr:hypothetical protein [Elusimicrobiota bacterium]
MLSLSGGLVSGCALSCLLNDATASEQGWRANAASIGDYLLIDYGLLNPKQVSKVRLYTASGGSLHGARYAVDYSTNGQDWTAAPGTLDPTGAAGQWHELTFSAGAYRFWRLRVTFTNGNAGYVDELELYTQDASPTGEWWLHARAYNDDNFFNDVGLALGPFRVDRSSPAADSFLHYNSTGGALAESQFGDLVAGATVQLKVRDWASGLDRASMKVSFSSNGGVNFTDVTTEDSGAAGPYIALSGPADSTGVETFQAFRLPVAASASNAHGSQAGSATNQVKFTLKDAAGNQQAHGPYAILIAPPPAAPSLSPSTILTASTTARLDWSYALGSTGFELRGSTRPDFQSAVVVTSATANAFATLDNLFPHATYYFEVRASSHSGLLWSSYSNRVSSMTNGIPPPFVGWSNPSASQISVVWSSATATASNPAGTRYEVQLSPSPSFTPFVSVRTPFAAIPFVIDANKQYYARAAVVNDLTDELEAWTVAQNTWTWSTTRSVQAAQGTPSTGVWQNSASQLTFHATFGSGEATHYRFTWTADPSTPAWSYSTGACANGGPGLCWLTANLTSTATPNSLPAMLTETTNYLHVRGENAFLPGETTRFGPFLYDNRQPYEPSGGNTDFKAYDRLANPVTEGNWIDLLTGVTAQLTVQEQGSGSGLDPQRGVPPRTVALWRLDEPSGTNAYDSGGGGQHGQLLGEQGGAAPTRVRGVFDGEAVRLDGAGGKVYSVPTFDLTSKPFTVQLWVRPETVPASGDVPLLSYFSENSALPRSLFIGLRNKKPYVSLSAQDASNSLTTSSDWELSPGLWYSLAYVVEGSAKSIYVNGVMASSRTASDLLEVSGQPLYLGGCVVGSGSPCESLHYHGVLDEVRIVTAAVSAEQIALDAQQGYGNFHVTYSTNSGYDWHRVAADLKYPAPDSSFPYISFANATPGDMVPRTLEARGISMTASTNTLTGNQGVNQLIFRAQDRAGNVLKSTHTILAASKFWRNSACSGGLWNTAANWSDGALPTAADDVVVDAVGSPCTIVAAGTSLKFKTLTLGRSSGGGGYPTTIHLSTNIAGGNLSVYGGSQIIFKTRSTSTLTGDLVVSSGSLVSALNDIAFSSAVHLSVGGTLVVGANGFISAEAMGYSGGANGVNGQGPAGSRGLQGNPASGAGHGGYGGNTNGAPNTLGGAPLGSLSNPNALGPGGGGGGA